jgi:hypothetical protein
MTDLSSFEGEVEIEQRFRKLLALDYVFSDSTFRDAFS